MLPTGQQAQTLMSSERSSHSDSSAVGVVSSRTSTAGSVATVHCGQKAMQCMAVHSILLVAWQAVVEALDSSIADDAREFEELCVTWNQLRPTVIRQIMGSHQDAVRQVRTMEMPYFHSPCCAVDRPRVSCYVTAHSKLRCWSFE